MTRPGCRAAVAEPFVIEGIPITITAAIGVSASDVTTAIDPRACSDRRTSACTRPNGAATADRAASGRRRGGVPLGPAAAWKNGAT